MFVSVKTTTHSIFSSKCIKWVSPLIGMWTCSYSLLSQWELEHLSGCVSTSSDGKISTLATKLVNIENHEVHSLSMRITWFWHVWEADNSPRGRGLFPIYSWRKQGWEKLSDLLKVNKLVSGRFLTGIQFCFFFFFFPNCDLSPTCQERSWMEWN